LYNVIIMKIALALLVVILAVLACGCTSATAPAGTSAAPAPAPNTAIPNLVGNWTGTMVGYDQSIGFSDYPNTTMTMVVTEQQGRIFNGHLRIFWKGKELNPGIAGVIGADGKTFSMVEQDNGYTFGTIVSKDEIELTYLLDATPYSAAIDSLKRVK
jgi:hypothetical protein